MIKVWYQEIEEISVEKVVDLKQWVHIESHNISMRDSRKLDASSCT
jgi:hypothetical protein